MYAVKVSGREAQKKIEELKQQGVYDTLRKPLREDGQVFLPLKREIKGAVKKELPSRSRIPSLREAFGIGSFDVVGDIVVLLIPEEQWKERDRIADHMMSLYSHVKAVYARRGVVGGAFRLPDLQLIGGKGSETVHTENGLQFKLDVTRTYFSPRQSSEREQLMRYVKSGDTVAVFFAGVGPIPVYISRFTDAEDVYAVEMNPAACRYMRGNLRLNGCENVSVVCGDVKEKLREVPPCDLIILPLPMGSWKFIDEACAVLKSGGHAIFYVGSTEEELEGKIINVRKRFEVEEVRREIQIAPRVFRFVVHARRK